MYNQTIFNEWQMPSKICMPGRMESLDVFARYIVAKVFLIFATKHYSD